MNRSLLVISGVALGLLAGCGGSDGGSGSGGAAGSAAGGGFGGTGATAGSSGAAGYAGSGAWGGTSGGGGTGGTGGVAGSAGTAGLGGAAGAAGGGGSGGTATGGTGGGTGGSPALGGPRVGGEIHVNATLPQDQEHPRVAMAEDGRFVVVWMSRGQAGGTTSELYGQRFNADGTKAGGEFQISATKASALYYGPENYDVAMAPDGRFVVAWSGYGSADRNVYAQAYAANGAKNGAQQTVDNTTDQWTEYKVSVAMNKSGEFTVLFDWEKGFTTGAKARQYSAAAAPKAAAFWVTNLRRAYELDLAIADAGDLVAVWRYYDINTEVFGQRIAAAGTLAGGEFAVNTSTTGAQDKPSVAMRGDGSFVVVWQSRHASPNPSQGVYAQFFDKSGAKTGTELAVSLATTGFMEQPGVGIDSAGRWVVTWSNDGGPVPGNGDDVWAQRFNANGTRPEPTFRVNTFDQGDQDDSRMAMASGGRFVIVWTDRRQEETVGNNTTDDAGVFAQIFQP